MKVLSQGQAPGQEFFWVKHETYIYHHAKYKCDSSKGLDDIAILNSMQTCWLLYENSVCDLDLKVTHRGRDHA